MISLVTMIVVRMNQLFHFIGEALANHFHGFFSTLWKCLTNHKYPFYQKLAIFLFCSRQFLNLDFIGFLLLLILDEKERDAYTRKKSRGIHI